MSERSRRSSDRGALDKIRFESALTLVRAQDVCYRLIAWHPSPRRAGAVVHRATATRDFGAAAEALGIAFGRSDNAALRQFGQIGLVTAGVLEARELVRRGEWMQVALAAADIVGHDEIEALMVRVGGRAADLAALSDRIEAGDYRGATTLFNARFHDTFGLSDDVQANLYRAAAIFEQRAALEALLDDGSHDDPPTWQRIDRLLDSIDIELHPDERHTIDRIFAFRDAIEDNDLPGAFDILRAGATDLARGRTAHAIDATAATIDALITYARSPFDRSLAAAGTPNPGTSRDAVGQ